MMTSFIPFRINILRINQYFDSRGLSLFPGISSCVVNCTPERVSFHVRKSSFFPPPAMAARKKQLGSCNRSFIVAFAIMSAMPGAENSTGKTGPLSDFRKGCEIIGTFDLVTPRLSAIRREKQDTTKQRPCDEEHHKADELHSRGNGRILNSARGNGGNPGNYQRRRCSNAGPTSVDVGPALAQRLSFVVLRLIGSRLGVVFNR